MPAVLLLLLLVPILLGASRATTLPRRLRVGAGVAGVALGWVLVVVGTLGGVIGLMKAFGAVGGDTDPAMKETILDEALWNTAWCFVPALVALATISLSQRWRPPAPSKQEFR